MRLAIVLALASACEQSETPVRPDPVPVPIPIPIPPPSPPPIDDSTLEISACYTIVVRIDRGGTWIGSPGVRCYAPFKSGMPDEDWMKAELGRLHTQISPSRCRPVVEVGAVAGITYKQLGVPLYMAWYAATFEVDVVEPDALAMTFDPAQRATRCTGALDLNKVARKPKLKRPRPLASSTPGTYLWRQLKSPRISVSRGAIFLDGVRLVRIAELPKTGLLEAITNALGTATNDRYSVVVEADDSIDAALLHRVVNTLKGRGYDDISYEITWPKPP